MLVNKFETIFVNVLTEQSIHFVLFNNSLFTIGQLILDGLVIAQM